MTPALAADVFGARLPLAVRYVELLAGAGVERGLLGPREAARLWDRHLLNCAVVQELLPAAAGVVDVGSGAGLPGIPLALARPDVSVTLLEPLARRVVFLREAVAILGLADQVRVVRGRAEDGAVAAEVGRAKWVTARAVAPLDRLVAWCRLVLAPGATLLALKGASVWEEVDRHRPALRSRGVADITVVELSLGGHEGSRLAEPSRVAVVRMK